MKTKFFFLLTIISLMACGPRLESIEVKNEKGQIISRYTQDPNTQLREGKSFSYFEDGAILEEAYYQNGILEKERKLYFENGQVQAKENYENNQFKGLYQAFYENGQLELEGYYTNGEMNNDWKRYYETGELMEVVTFKSNEENGPFIEYYKNGHKKAEGVYLEGDNEHGELKMYSETGELVRTMNCVTGRCQTTWKKMEN